MKKLSLIVLAISLSTFSFSQFSIGLSKQQVIAKVRKENGSSLKITQKVVDDGVICISWTTEIGLEQVYVDNTNLSMLHTITPKNKTFLNGLIEKYNSLGVVVSATEWKFYIDGWVFEVKLTYSKEHDEYTFYTTKQ
jgi:hypothetical protein